MVSKSVQSLLNVAKLLHKNAGEPAFALEGLVESAEPMSEGSVSDLEEKVQRFVEALVGSGETPEEIEDAFSQVLADKPPVPGFEENPAIKGNWGEGDERDILLSSTTINLLKVADMLSPKKETAMERLARVGEDFLGKAR